MRGDLRYAPSDVYETFPRPSETAAASTAGTALETAQQNAMSNRKIGLTSLYNLVHTATETASDVEEIRQMHIKIDRTIAEAYGWDNFELKHGFYSTPQGERFTVAQDVQTEILDRLLELNHTLYQDEIKKGLHTPEAKRRRAATRKAKAKARSSAPAQKPGEEFADGLFPQPDALF
jgi:hypothetical protein